MSNYGAQLYQMRNQSKESTRTKDSYFTECKKQKKIAKEIKKCESKNAKLDKKQRKRENKEEVKRVKSELKKCSSSICSRKTSSDINCRSYSPKPPETCKMYYPRAAENCQTYPQKSRDNCCCYPRVISASKPQPVYVRNSTSTHAMSKIDSFDFLPNIPAVSIDSLDLYKRRYQRKSRPAQKKSLVDTTNLKRIVKNFKETYSKLSNMNFCSDRDRNRDHSRDREWERDRYQRYKRPVSMNLVMRRSSELYREEDDRDDGYDSYGGHKCNQQYILCPHQCNHPVRCSHRPCNYNNRHLPRANHFRACRCVRVYMQTQPQLQKGWAGFKPFEKLTLENTTNATSTETCSTFRTIPDDFVFPKPRPQIYYIGHSSEKKEMKKQKKAIKKKCKKLKKQCKKMCKERKKHNSDKSKKNRKKCECGYEQKKTCLCENRGNIHSKSCKKPEKVKIDPVQPQERIIPPEPSDTSNEAYTPEKLSKESSAPEGSSGLEGSSGPTPTPEGVSASKPCYFDPFPLFSFLSNFCKTKPQKVKSNKSIFQKVKEVRHVKTCPMKSKLFTKKEDHSHDPKSCIDCTSKKSERQNSKSNKKVTNDKSDPKKDKKTKDLEYFKPPKNEEKNRAVPENKSSSEKNADSDQHSSSAVSQFEKDSGMSKSTSRTFDSSVESTKCSCSECLQTQHDFKQKPKKGNCEVVSCGDNKKNKKGNKYCDCKKDEKNSTAGSESNMCVYYPCRCDGKKNKEKKRTKNKKRCDCDTKEGRPNDSKKEDCFGIVCCCDDKKEKKRKKKKGCDCEKENDSCNGPNIEECVYFDCCCDKKKKKQKNKKKKKCDCSDENPHESKCNIPPTKDRIYINCDDTKKKDKKKSKKKCDCPENNKHPNECKKDECFSIISCCDDKKTKKKKKGKKRCDCDKEEKCPTYYYTLESPRHGKSTENTTTNTSTSIVQKTSETKPNNPIWRSSPTECHYTKEKFFRKIAEKLSPIPFKQKHSLVYDHEMRIFRRKGNKEEQTDSKTLKRKLKEMKEAYEKREKEEKKRQKELLKKAKKEKAAKSNKKKHS